MRRPAAWLGGAAARPAVSGRLLVSVLLVAPALLCPADRAMAADAELDGRTSLRGVLSADDSPNNATTGFLFLDTDVRARELTSTGLAGQLDATFLLDLTEAQERRFGETERLDQVRQLYVEQPDLYGVDIRAGRRIVADAGNAWVDGLDLELRLDERRASIGLYGGLAPDRFDHSPTTRYQAMGVYGTLQRAGFDGSLGGNVQLSEGSTDRAYLFNRLHYRIIPGLFVAAYVVLDLLDEVDATTLLTSVDWSPTQAVNLTLGYSRYALEPYRDQTVYRNVVEPSQALLVGDEVVSLVYERVRLAASVRFLGRYYHYQQIEWKQRQQDGRDGWLYTVGVRNDNVMGWGTRLDVRTTLHDNYVSDSYILALDVGQSLGSAWSLDARLTWFSGRTVGRGDTSLGTERGRTFDEAQEIILAGLSAGWRPAAAHEISADYDLILESELQDARNQEDLVVHTAMARYTFRY